MGTSYSMNCFMFVDVFCIERLFVMIIKYSLSFIFVKKIKQNLNYRNYIYAYIFVF